MATPTQDFNRIRLVAGLLLVLAAIFLAPGTCLAVSDTVLHSFGKGSDGNFPDRGSLVFDSSGNLYGTTNLGGTNRLGTVFELSPKAGGGWKATVIYSFDNGDGGNSPQGGVILDSTGALYGTTYSGGSHNGGTVFKLIPHSDGTWTEKVLHSFGQDSDGYAPIAGVTVDSAGNLYGTTVYGGAFSDGTVFKLTPDGDGNWSEKVLHSFDDNGTDGADPYGVVILDSAGNLYGTTYYGGTNTCGGPGCGIVFELSPGDDGTWTETVLHNFNFDGRDGENPAAGLLLDSGRNLYGSTTGGGANDEGAVFELKVKNGGGWTEKVLHSFDITDGYHPDAPLILDSSGNLYSTTLNGGGYSLGTVFELIPQGDGTWTEKLLHSLGNGTDGAVPYAGLVFDTAGNLYGMTRQGGNYSGGTVFEVSH